MIADTKPKRTFHAWCLNFREYLKAKRGRQAEVARALETRRQNIHRWFVRQDTAIPAWAAVHANVFYYQAVRLGRDKQEELPLENN